MIEAVFLGFLQGMTEFLPVSSSGHLVIAKYFLGIHSQSVVLEVCLHAGTLLSVIVFFHKDIIAVFKDKTALRNIGLVTVVTGTLGYAFADTFKLFFQNPGWVAIALILNGAILISTRKRTPRGDAISARKSVFLGLTQAMAIVPGISRSGITITTLIHSGIKREEAFRFSFLIAIPVIFGAFASQVGDIAHFQGLSYAQLSVGSLFAFVSGLMALRILKDLVVKEKFYLFGFYSISIGAALIFLLPR